MSAPDQQGLGPSHLAEVARARRRRQRLGIQRPVCETITADDPSPANAPGEDAAQWGLALSGGGIRSATFSLGVIQAMAHARDPGVPPVATLSATRSATRSTSPWPLLAQFDFLSTVSGGGYIGGFLSSLFVPGRLTGAPQDGPPEDEAVALARGFQALQEEPPGRIHRNSEFDPAHPGKAALAWLRDNGRYMAPSSSGDMLYAATVAVRNWFATQYVVGTLIVLMLALVQALRWTAASTWPAWRALETAWLVDARNSETLLWWSPSWAAPGVLMLMTAVPLGIAYWFSHPTSGSETQRRTRQAPDDRLSQEPQAWTAASLLGVVIATVLAALGTGALLWLQRLPVALGLFGAAWCTVLAVLWYLGAVKRTNADGQGSLAKLRVVLTRWLSTSLKWGLVLAGLAAIETLAQTLWLWVSLREGALLSALLAAVVWLLKEGITRVGEPGADSWLKKVPLGLLAGVVGATLWLSVAAALDILLLQVAWPEGWADPKVLQNHDLSVIAMLYAWSAVGLSMLLAQVVGRFPGFLNLSTLQGLYSARITRAYLGATNAARFRKGASAEARDVAEPILGDSLSPEDIHRNTLAPIHFVNVCVNQSVSPGEQLIQRDRKGKPLVLAPGGFYFDQDAHPMRATGAGELSQKLSFGEWLGVSGAAFSTGLGRGTGLGMSLVMGFANVRLGRWWQGLETSGLPKLPWACQHLTTQAYLINEMTGTFHGDRRPYLYLSDGGHHENTAVFELLRLDRPRQVRVIVVTDCGCDPDYRFDDLANLIRLVRIDHGLEITVNTDATEAGSPLREVFTRPEWMRRGADGKLPEPDGRCAVLLDVRGTERSVAMGVDAGALHARIILIKPRLIDGLTVDLMQYSQTHPSFPQETTMDQFFDEAQWESYRQLGLRVGQRVFEGDGSDAYREALWARVLHDLPRH